MGRILRAHDLRIGRDVALKELIDRSPSSQARFEREARLTARLQHPGIVSIYEIGRWPDGSPFYAMRMVPGRTLKAAVAQTKTLRERLALLRPVSVAAEAIAYAHAQGVIHRDLTPANLLCGAFGEAVVIDWGLAKQRGDATESAGEGAPYRTAQDERLTATGTVMGTLPFMPPEQARGEVVDERADVYALGAILYFVVTGRSPYDGTRRQHVLDELLEGPPEPVAELEQDAPRDLVSVIVRAMARNPSDRYGSAGDLAEELTRFQEGRLVGAHDYSSWDRLRRFARRHRSAVVVAGALLSILATTAILSVRRIVRERARAEASADDFRRVVLKQYESQGRGLVVADNPVRGLAFLAEAARLGSQGVAHDFAVAEGILATEGELYTVRHDDGIARVRFSPDGSTLLTVGRDNEARLWNAASGEAQARLRHDTQVLRAAFSPDGALIATGTREWPPGGLHEATVALWSRDGVVRHRMTTRGGVQAIEFSPDGGLLVTTTFSDEVTLWDVPTGVSLARLLEGEDVIEASAGTPCSFSPDGRLIACGDRRGVIRIWDARTRRELTVLRGHTDRIQTLRFSKAGTQLVSASRDHTAILWRTGSWRREATLRHADRLNAASFSPDDRRVLTASADRSAIVWDAGTGEPELTLRGHLGSVNQAVFSPDGRRIATVSSDATAVLWDAVTGERLARRLGHSGPIPDVTFSPDSKRMATASIDFTATVWSTEPTRRVTRLVGYQGEVRAADIAPDGARVATGGKDGLLRVWDAATGRELMAVRAHDKDIFDLRFSPEGGRIATAGADHRVKIWSARDGALLATLTGHVDWVESISWHPSGDELASASQDGTIRIWSAKDGATRREIHGHDGKSIFVVAYAPSGDVLASTGDDGTTRLWDPGSGGETARFRNDEGRYSLVFSPTGEEAVSVTSKNSAVIWRVRDGRIMTELVGHVGGILEVAWGHQGLIATASADRTARIWDPVNGEVLAVLTHASEVMRPVMEGTGRYLLTTSADGTAALWNLPRWTGNAVEFERLLRCRVPYQVDGERVVPRQREMKACRAAAP